MVTLGWVLDNMKDWLSDDTTNTQDKIKRIATLALYQVCGERDWDFLKRTISPSVATLSATVPIVMPGDLAKVIGAIVDGDNRYIYSPVRDRRPLKHLYNWFYDNPVSTVLASGTTITATKGSTAITSTAEFPSSDAAGEYIRIGENMGIYKIATWTSASAMTLEQAFRGDTVTGDTYFEVRPVGTRQINFCDQNADFVAPSAPEITYTVQPLPLINRWDAIDVPNNGLPVFFRAFHYQALQRGWTRVAQAAKELAQQEFATAQRQEPSDHERLKPLTRFAVHSKSHNWGVW